MIMPTRLNQDTISIFKRGQNLTIESTDRPATGLQNITVSVPHGYTAQNAENYSAGITINADPSEAKSLVDQLRQAFTTGPSPLFREFHCRDDTPITIAHRQPVILSSPPRYEDGSATLIRGETKKGSQIITDPEPTSRHLRIALSGCNKEIQKMVRAIAAQNEEAVLAGKPVKPGEDPLFPIVQKIMEVLKAKGTIETDSISEVLAKAKVSVGRGDGAALEQGAG